MPAHASRWQPMSVNYSISKPISSHVVDPVWRSKLNLFQSNFNFPLFGNNWHLSKSCKQSILSPPSNMSRQITLEGISKHRPHVGQGYHCHVLNFRKSNIWYCEFISSTASSNQWGWFWSLVMWRSEVWTLDVETNLIYRTRKLQQQNVRSPWNTFAILEEISWACEPATCREVGRLLFLYNYHLPMY